MRTMLESFPEWAGDSYWIVNAFDAIPEDMLRQGMGGYTETRGAWKATLLVVGSGLTLSIGAPDP